MDDGCRMLDAPSPDDARRDARNHARAVQRTHSVARRRRRRRRRARALARPPRRGSTFRLSKFDDVVTTSCVCVCVRVHDS